MYIHVYVCEYNIQASGENKAANRVVERDNMTSAIAEEDKGNEGGEKGARERARERMRGDTRRCEEVQRSRRHEGGGQEGGGGVMREVQERCDPAVCSGSRERRTLPRARARARASASLQNNASEH